MRRTATGTSLAAACVVAGLGAFGVAQAQELVVDAEMTVSGIDVACTGVGDEANSDARWPTYAVRIEFAGPGGEYLSDLDLSVADNRGQVILQAHCNGPWFLARLEPGRYEIEATSTSGEMRSARFSAPSHGQSRTILRFR